MENSESNDDESYIEEKKPENTTRESSPIVIPSNSTRRERTESEASPPGFVTLEEIMKAANGVSNMSLAHEIAVDADFHLEKVEPPSNSLHKIVKEIAHKAFWDLLEKELEGNPPEFERALILLEEIKEWLLSLLLPHQTKTIQEIQGNIDIDLIKQQVENGTFDLKHYSQYIISLMGRLCAPGRDEKIRELTTLTDVVPLYKGIFETLEFMRLDMANFTIRQIRPHIAACSVEYERKKFEDYLKITPDGLRNTREWLYRHKMAANPDSASPSNPVALIPLVLVDSFIELLDWNEENAWPETVVLDEGRFSELRHKLSLVEILSSILLVTLSQSIGPLQSSTTFRQTLKEHLAEHLAVILDQPKSLKELQDVMPSVTTQVINDIEKGIQAENLPQLTPEAIILISGQISGISQPDNRVRQIIHTRLMEFLRQVISSEVARPTQIPVGLSLFKSEIAAIAGQFARLVSHNRAVFAQHYADLIKNHCID
nr:EOG090X04Z9 [Polyphemus pediculus]